MSNSLEDALPREQNPLPLDGQEAPSINGNGSASSSAAHAIMSPTYYETFVNLFSDYLPKEQVLIYLYSGLSGLYTAFNRVVSLLSGSKQDRTLNQASQSQEHPSNEVPIASSDPVQNSELIIEENIPEGKREEITQVEEGVWASKDQKLNAKEIPSINGADPTSSIPEYSIMSPNYYGNFINIFSNYLPKEQVLIYLYSGPSGLCMAFTTVESLLSGGGQEPALNQESQSQEHPSNEVPIVSSDPEQNSELIIEENAEQSAEDNLANSSDLRSDSESRLEEDVSVEQKDESTEAEASSSDQKLISEPTPQNNQKLNAKLTRQFKKSFGENPDPDAIARMSPEKFLQLKQQLEETLKRNKETLPDRQDIYSNPNSNSSDSLSGSSSSAPIQSHSKKKKKNKGEESYIPGLSSSSSSSSISSPQPESQEESNPFSGCIEIDGNGFVSVALPHLKHWVKQQVKDYANTNPEDPEYNFNGGIESNPHITIGHTLRNNISQIQKQFRKLERISFTVLGAPVRMCMSEKGSANQSRKTVLLVPVDLDDRSIAIIQDCAERKMAGIDWARSSIITKPHITLAQISCKHRDGQRCHFERHPKREKR